LAIALAVGSGCGFSTLDGLESGEGDTVDGAKRDASDAARRADAEGGRDGHDASIDVSSGDASEGDDRVEASDGQGFEDAGSATATVPDAGASCDGGCPGNGYCADSECAYPSCIARLLSVPTSPSAVYSIDPDGPGSAPPFRAYCEMILDGGGWTLVLKVDGAKTTFVHDAPLWTSADTLAPDAPNLDRIEAKLAGFATMPFGYLRVGMIQGASTRWLILPVDGGSLRALMTTGFHATNVGRSAWERLPSRGSLQNNCNREGINVETLEANVRIGIVANNQNDCSTCNSWIGFGAEGLGTSDMACGNYAAAAPDNGNRTDPLFGYVMVR